MWHSLRTHKLFALSVTAPAAKSQSTLGTGPVAFDFAALRSARAGKAPQQVRKCTNLLWFDLDEANLIFLMRRSFIDLLTHSHKAISGEGNTVV